MLLKAVGSTPIAPLGVAGTASLAGCFDSDSEPSPTDISQTKDDTTTIEGGEEISVFHYNLEMGINIQVVGAVVNQIKNHRPTVVSLNEVCAYHYELIEQQISSEYRGTFDTHALWSNCGYDAQGVGIFLLDGDPSTEEILDIGQKTVCISSATEPSIRACTTHLSAPGDGDPVAEVEELHTEMQTQASNGPVVFAGDLNLDPWEPAIQQLYTDFHELHQDGEDCGTEGNRPGGSSQPPASCTFKHPDQGWKKIDYVFVDKQHFRSNVTAEVRPGTECGEDNTERCSDHQQLWGTATLKRPDNTPQPQTPSSSMDEQLTWTFRVDFSGDTECPDPSNLSDPILCKPPVWVGSYEVADDGTVNGEGERLEFGPTDYCGMLDANQPVTVTGDSPDGGETLNLTLEFDAPDISVTEPSLPDEQCNDEQAQRLARLYRDDLPEGTVEIEGSFRHKVPVTVDGYPYRFESCDGNGSQFTRMCLPSDLANYRR